MLLIPSSKVFKLPSWSFSNLSLAGSSLSCCSIMYLATDWSYRNITFLVRGEIRFCQKSSSSPPQPLTKLNLLKYRIDSIYTSPRIVQEATASRLAQEFRIVLPSKVKSTSSVYWRLNGISTVYIVSIVTHYVHVE